MNKDKVRYYREFTDDFETSPDQEFELGADYEYIRDGFFSKLKSALIYSAAVVFGTPFCRLFLHVRYKNRRVLKAAKGEGYFIYANHTQPVGDVFIPALAALPKRIYVVVSPANYTLPVIGKILPFLGALPISSSPSGMRSFTEAVGRRIDEKKVVTIYPEAHVWEYYTDIRPFSDASFRYPVKLSAPVFSQTVTYQKRRFSKKPRTTVYIDGPFYADETLPKREQSRDLRDRVYACMKERSKESNCQYIVYEKVKD